jgi:hypothetical protein
MGIETIIILMLMTFILGLVVGMILARPLMCGLFTCCNIVLQGVRIFLDNPTNCATRCRQ